MLLSGVYATIFLRTAVLIPITGWCWYVELLYYSNSRSLMVVEILPGTYFKPGVVSPMFQWLAKIADLAVAW